MVALHWILPVFFSALALAAPASRLMPIGASKIKYPVVPPLLLCDIPFVNKVFCPIRRASAVTIKTPLGSAAGVADGGATRFVVQYGQAPRWGASKPAAKWALPCVHSARKRARSSLMRGSRNNLTDASGSPLACPQLGVDAATTAEDCLSAILYVPPGLSASSGAPTMVWIHGGSFTSGSATAPGLDGAKLAVATKAVVAVVQYRLGGVRALPLP
jgi:carboxylesterase type B